MKELLIFFVLFYTELVQANDIESFKITQTETTEKCSSLADQVTEVKAFVYGAIKPSKVDSNGCEVRQIVWNEVCINNLNATGFECHGNGIYTGDPWRERSFGTLSQLDQPEYETSTPFLPVSQSSTKGFNTNNFTCTAGFCLNIQFAVAYLILGALLSIATLLYFMRKFNKLGS